MGFNRYGIQRESRALFTRDIVPAKTKIIKNESYSLKNDDIERSCPRKLNQPLNKPYYYLRNDDISGSQTAAVAFKTKRDPCNPLNPVYKLPSFEPLDPIVPRFIRDSFQINVRTLPLCTKSFGFLISRTLRAQNRRDYTRK